MLSLMKERWDTFDQAPGIVTCLICDKRIVTDRLGDHYTEHHKINEVISSLNFATIYVNIHEKAKRDWHDEQNKKQQPNLS